MIAALTRKGRSPDESYLSVGADFANLYVMNKKLPFLALGYILGLVSLAASLPAKLYTKAVTNEPVAEDANCKGFPR